MNSYRFHEQPVLWTSTAAFSSLRSGLALSPSTVLGTLSLVEGPGAKRPVETCNESFSLFARAYSRIQRIRELCRLDSSQELVTE